MFYGLGNPSLVEWKSDIWCQKPLQPPQLSSSVASIMSGIALLTKHTLICKYVTSIREKVESMIDVYHSFIIHSTANYRNNNNSDLINTARNITAFINYSVYFCN